MTRDEDDRDGEEPIVLTYRLTIEDLRAPMRGLLFLAVRDRPFLVLGMIFLSIALVASGNLPLAVKLIVVVGVVLLLVAPVASMRAHARSLYRMSEKHGEYHAVFDGAGIRITSALMKDVNEWSMYSRYAETKDCFVLLHWRTGRPALVLVVPKRGLSDPADVDRLRALLDQQLTRV